MTICVIVGVVIIISFLLRILSNFSPAVMSAAVFGDVTSANVVGYAGKGLDEEGGAIITAPMFVNVGDDGKIALDSVSLIPGEGVLPEDMEYNIEIQTLANDGSTGEEDYMWNGTEWVDSMLKPVKGVEFTPGQGLWIYNYIGMPVSFQSAGQVNKSDLILPLDEEGGAIAIANTFPVEVELDKFVWTLGEGVLPEDIEYNLEIQTLNNDGSTGDEDYMWSGTAWVDEMLKPVSGVKFAAGSGIWFYNYAGVEVTLRIPAPTSDL